jgi:hypothetical protein
MPKAKYKNPKGGLTQAGRDYYKRTQGSKLKAGVKSYSSASESDKKRWVRWALRFAGRSDIPPLKKPNGEPTRFALMFAAWGEPVPTSVSSVRKVYQKALRRRDQLGMGKAAKKKVNAEESEETEDFANIKINVESGNPYRNSATGKFGFELPGVDVITGRRFLIGMQKEAKDALATRARFTGATQMALKEGQDGDVIIVLANAGRVLDKFALPNAIAGEDGEPMGSTGEEGTTGQEQQLDLNDEILKDSILYASRNLNLDDEGIISSVEERVGRELSDSEKSQLREEVDKQRLEDLIQYLNVNIERKLDKGSKVGIVRIQTPRGYIRRTFSNLDAISAEKVFTRLRAMGWSEKIIEEQVAGTLPAKLRNELGIQEGEGN